MTVYIALLNGPNGRWFRVIAFFLSVLVFSICESEVMRTVSVVHAQEPQQAGVQTAGPVIKAKVNEVLVPVVVRDAHGHPVDSLSKGDFQMDAVSGVMEELADGTGGTFYHNNNDLESGFKTLLAGAECRYLLAFSPAKMKSRVHHSLKVKVNEHGLTVQARGGYSTPAPEKHKN
jgi:hypothetical protein